MFISKSFSFSKHSAQPRFGLFQAPEANPSGMARALIQRLASAFSRRHASAGALEHLATLPLSAQPSLVLVRLGPQNLLLGATAQGISVLASSPADATEQSSLAAETVPHQESPRP